MDIGKCKFGSIVRRKKESVSSRFSSDNGEYGMIVGLTNNAPSADKDTRSDPDRVCVLVEWQSGGRTSIHPDNIDLVKR